MLSHIATLLRQFICLSFGREQYFMQKKTLENLKYLSVITFISWHPDYYQPVKEPRYITSSLFSKKNLFLRCIRSYENSMKKSSLQNYGSIKTTTMDKHEKIDFPKVISPLTHFYYCLEKYPQRKFSPSQLKELSGTKAFQRLNTQRTQNFCSQTIYFSQIWLTTRHNTNNDIAGGEDTILLHHVEVNISWG